MLSDMNLCKVYETEEMSIWTGYRGEVSITYYKYTNKIGDDRKNKVLICLNNNPIMEFEVP